MRWENRVLIILQSLSCFLGILCSIPRTFRSNSLLTQKIPNKLLCSFFFYYCYFILSSHGGCFLNTDMNCCTLKCKLLACGLDSSMWFSLHRSHTPMLSSNCMECVYPLTPIPYSVKSRSKYLHVMYTSIVTLKMFKTYEICCRQRNNSCLL